MGQQAGCRRAWLRLPSSAVRTRRGWRVERLSDTLLGGWRATPAMRSIQPVLLAFEAMQQDQANSINRSGNRDAKEHKLL